MGYIKLNEGTSNVFRFMLTLPKTEWSVLCLIWAQINVLESAKRSTLTWHRRSMSSLLHNLTEAIRAFALYLHNTLALIYIKALVGMPTYCSFSLETKLCKPLILYLNCKKKVSLVWNLNCIRLCHLTLS